MMKWKHQKNDFNGDAEVESSLAVLDRVLSEFDDIETDSFFDGDGESRSRADMLEDPAGMSERRGARPPAAGPAPPPPVDRSTKPRGGSAAVTPTASWRSSRSEAHNNTARSSVSSGQTAGKSSSRSATAASQPQDTSSGRRGSRINGLLQNFEGQNREGTSPHHHQHRRHQQQAAVARTKSSVEKVKCEPRPKRSQSETRFGDSVAARKSPLKIIRPLGPPPTSRPPPPPPPTQPSAPETPPKHGITVAGQRDVAQASRQGRSRQRAPPQEAITEPPQPPPPPSGNSDSQLEAKPSVCSQPVLPPFPAKVMLRQKSSPQFSYLPPDDPRRRSLPAKDNPLLTELAASMESKIKRLSLNFEPSGPARFPSRQARGMASLGSEDTAISSRSGSIRSSPDRGAETSHGSPTGAGDNRLSEQLPNPENPSHQLAASPAPALPSVDVITASPSSGSLPQKYLRGKPPSPPSSSSVSVERTAQWSPPLVPLPPRQTRNSPPSPVPLPPKQMQNTVASPVWLPPKEANLPHSSRGEDGSPPELARESPSRQATTLASARRGSADPAQNDSEEQKPSLPAKQHAARNRDERRPPARRKRDRKRKSDQPPPPEEAQLQISMLLNRNAGSVTGTPSSTLQSQTSAGAGSSGRPQPARQTSERPRPTRPAPAPPIQRQASAPAIQLSGSISSRHSDTSAATGARSSQSFRASPPEDRRGRGLRRCDDLIKSRAISTDRVVERDENGVRVGEVTFGLEGGSVRTFSYVSFHEGDSPSVGPVSLPEPLASDQPKMSPTSSYPKKLFSPIVKDRLNDSSNMYIPAPPSPRPDYYDSELSETDSLTQRGSDHEQLFEMNDKTPRETRKANKAGKAQISPSIAEKFQVTKISPPMHRKNKVKESKERHMKTRLKEKMSEKDLEIEEGLDTSGETVKEESRMSSPVLDEPRKQEPANSVTISEEASKLPEESSREETPAVPLPSQDHTSSPNRMQKEERSTSVETASKRPRSKEETSNRKLRTGNGEITGKEDRQEVEKTSETIQASGKTPLQAMIEDFHRNLPPPAAFDDVQNTSIDEPPSLTEELEIEPDDSYYSDDSLDSGDERKKRNSRRRRRKCDWSTTTSFDYVHRKEARKKIPEKLTNRDEGISSLESHNSASDDNEVGRKKARPSGKHITKVDVAGCLEQLEEKRAKQDVISKSKNKFDSIRKLLKEGRLEGLEAPPPSFVPPPPPPLVAPNQDRGKFTPKVSPAGECGAQQEPSPGPAGRQPHPTQSEVRKRTKKEEKVSPRPRSLSQPASCLLETSSGPPAGGRSSESPREVRTSRSFLHQRQSPFSDYRRPAAPSPNQSSTKRRLAPQPDDALRMRSESPLRRNRPVRPPEGVQVNPLTHMRPSPLLISPLSGCHSTESLHTSLPPLLREVEPDGSVSSAKAHLTLPGDKRDVRRADSLVVGKRDKESESKFKFSIFKGFWRRKQYSLEQV